MSATRNAKPFFEYLFYLRKLLENLVLGKNLLLRKLISTVVFVHMENELNCKVKHNLIAMILFILVPTLGKCLGCPTAANILKQMCALQKGYWILAVFAKIIMFFAIPKLHTNFWNAWYKLCCFALLPKMWTTKMRLLQNGINTRSYRLNFTTAQTRWRKTFSFEDKNCVFMSVQCFKSLIMCFAPQKHHPSV